MGTGRRVLAGSVFALAVSGIVAGAAVSAFANGPDNQLGGHPSAMENLDDSHPVLAIQQYGPFTTNGTASTANPTAVEYAHVVRVSNVLDDVSA